MEKLPQLHSTINQSIIREIFDQELQYLWKIVIKCDRWAFDQNMKVVHVKYHPICHYEDIMQHINSQSVAKGP